MYTLTTTESLGLVIFFLAMYELTGYFYFDVPTLFQMVPPWVLEGEDYKHKGLYWFTTCYFTWIQWIDSHILLLMKCQFPMCYCVVSEFCSGHRRIAQANCQRCPLYMGDCNSPMLFFLQTLWFMLSSGDLQACSTETLRFTCTTKQVFQLWCSELLLMWKCLQKPVIFSMVASSSFWETTPWRDVCYYWELFLVPNKVTTAIFLE